MSPLLGGRNRKQPVGPVGPAVNTKVVLELHAMELELSSRVEDDANGLLYVAAVAFPGDHELVTEGLEMTVSWAVSRGMCCVDSVLVERVSGQPTLWALEPLEEVRLSQRRRFVRAAVLGTLDFEIAVPVPQQRPAGDSREESQAADGAAADGAAAGGAVADGAAADGAVGSATALVHGRLVDLCEGGAQVVAPAEAVVVQAGQEVPVVLGFGEHRVTLVAHVVRNQPDAKGARVLALLFDPDEATADLIRSEVLRTQLKARTKESTW